MTTTESKIDRFALDRAYFVNELLSYSRILHSTLTHEHPLTKLIADALAHRAEEFDFDQQLTPDRALLVDVDVPRCFYIRTDLIKTQMQEQSRILEARPHLARQVSVVIKMLSMQVGRLTLYRREDVYAEEMDRRADIQDLEERVLREVGDEALRRRLRRIHSVWVGLNSAVAGCDCWQCERRRGRR